MLERSEAACSSDASVVGRVEAAGNSAEAVFYAKVEKKKKKILITRCSSRQAGASVQVMWVFHPHAVQQSARCRRKNASLRCLTFFQLHLQLFFPPFFCPFNPQSITATVMSLFFAMKMGRYAILPQTPDQTRWSCRQLRPIWNSRYFIHLFISFSGGNLSVCVCCNKGEKKKWCSSSKFAWRWAISRAAEYITITWLKYCCRFFFFPFFVE